MRGPEMIGAMLFVVIALFIVPMGFMKISFDTYFDKRAEKSVAVYEESMDIAKKRSELLGRKLKVNEIRMEARKGGKLEKIFYETAIKEETDKREKVIRVECK